MRRAGMMMLLLGSLALTGCGSSSSNKPDSTKPGKAAGSKKKRSKKPEEKAKSRSRNRKNKGRPGSKSVSSDGFAPLMKKKPKD